MTDIEELAHEEALDRARYLSTPPTNSTIKHWKGSP